MAASDLTPTDLGILAHSAMRYALGRRTYVVSDVCNVLRVVLGECDLATWSQVQREVQRALDGDAAGDACDRQEWERLMSWMKGDR
jgi:hypothetical protein